MPKLSYPKDMSDLTGEELSPDPIRDNVQAIDELVNGSGLDWENVSQWSLDHRHVYPQDVPPGDPKATKVAISARSDGLIQAAAISLVFPALGDWKTISPPGERSVNVGAGSAAFIYGSHFVAWTSSYPTNLTMRLRIQTKLTPGGWGWTNLYESPIGGGSVQSMIGAVKAPTSGTLSVRLQFRADMATLIYPQEWGYSNLSVFVVNQ